MQRVNLSSSSGSSDDAGSMAEEVQLTVKYLSSPKLLRLQLQDAALRRHFLVQVLRSVKPHITHTGLLEKGYCIACTPPLIHQNIRGTAQCSP